MGVRGVVLLAPSAFLASAANTSELTSVLLPPRLRDVKDTGFDAALVAWTIQATNSSTPSTFPVMPTSFAQRAWDNPCCTIQADVLFETAADQANKARLLAACSPGSGDWLETLPLSTIRTQDGVNSYSSRSTSRCSCRSITYLCLWSYSLSRRSPRLVVSLRLRYGFKT